MALGAEVSPRVPQVRQFCSYLYNFLLSVKAVTLIFISGRGSTISSAKEGKSD